MTGPFPRTWVLLGERTGDNNQVLALAEALGWPFETRTLRYNLLRAVNASILGRSLASLERSCRRFLAPPWPDLVLAIGRRSVPVARWIQHKSGGKAKLVRVGHPRVDPALFDLVITTRQYPVPPGDNVVLLPLAMSRYRERPAPTAEEAEWLQRIPRPHLLMALGGATKYWALAGESVAKAAARLADRAARAGGCLIVVGSRRTEPEVLEAVDQSLARQANCHVAAPDRIRFPVLLDDADEIFVTGDSVSMISEAVLTGKPVGLIPIELSAKGRRALGQDEDDTPRRDLRRFWKHLQSQGRLGTLDEPLRSEVEDPTDIAAEAVRKLLGDLVE